MKTIIFTLFSNYELATNIALKLQAPTGKVEIRSFPDAETYLRIISNVDKHKVIIIDSLDKPNQKILPLLFFIKAAKAQGAKSVGLLSPYLPYMRQDKQFKQGEAVTSKYFAQLLSQNLDWLITIDPHLHRYNDLSEIYTIPTHVISACDTIAGWIKEHINLPLIIGPDAESKQWAQSIADKADAPYIVLAKNRINDSKVEITLPDLQQFKKYTPVLVDDIISTAQTILTVIDQLHTTDMPTPVCIGVHALFNEAIYRAILASSCKQLVTCNTIQHSSNGIDLTEIMTQSLKDWVL